MSANVFRFGSSGAMRQRFCGAGVGGVGARALCTLLGALFAAVCLVRLGAERRYRIRASSDDNCARNYEACGAIPAPLGSSRCCNPAFFCLRRPPYFSQCRPRPTALTNLNNVDSRRVKMLLVDVPRAAPASWRLALRAKLAKRLRRRLRDPFLVVSAHHTLPVLYVRRTGARTHDDAASDANAAETVANAWNASSLWRAAEIVRELRDVSSVSAVTELQVEGRSGRTWTLRTLRLGTNMGSAEARRMGSVSILLGGKNNFDSNVLR